MGRPKSTAVSAAEGGIDTRDLRRPRKLPPDEIEAAKELLATDGKQGVIEFVEDLCAKQAKEKQALEKKITHLSADAEAHEKLIVNKNKKIDELDREIHDLRKHTKDWHPRALDVCLEVSEVGARVLEAVDRLHALRDAILTEDFGPEREAAIEAMAVVYYDMVHQIVDISNDLGNACQHHFMGYKEKARPLLNMAEV